MSRIFTIIGGASAYVPGLLKALIKKSPLLRLEEVRLHDIDEARLDLVASLCTRMAESGGASFKITPETSIYSAVKDANVILNSSRPGGLKARRIDETLPLEFGIPGQETVGPGGFFFALRSVPEALRVAEAVRSAAPDAIFLNYTNPSNIVAQALIDAGHKQIIGLCDQAYEDMEALSLALKLGGRRIEFDCLGLNHASFYASLRSGGEQLALPPGSLEPPPFFDEEHKLRFSISENWARAHNGYWPNSYLAYYWQPRKFVKLSRRIGPRTDVILAELPLYYEHFAEQAAKEQPQLTHYRGSSGFGDLAAHMLEALAGELSLPLVLNLENGGTSNLFAPDTVIESVGEVSAAGAKAPASVPEAPPDMLELLRRLEQYQRAAARAAAAPERDSLIEALAANPLLPDRAAAERMLDQAQLRYGGLLEI